MKCRSARTQLCIPYHESTHPKFSRLTDISHCRYNDNVKKTPFRHFSNTDHARNSASAVLDSYTNALTMSQWAKNSAHAYQMNANKPSWTLFQMVNLAEFQGM